MKRMIIAGILIFSIFWGGCQEINFEPNEKFYTAIESNILTLELIMNCTTKGLSDVFRNMIKDSASRAEFLKEYIENIRFFEDNSGYFYSYDTNHLCIAHPIRKDIIGIDIYNDFDSRGKGFAKEIFDSTKTFGKCWISYHWINPSTKREEDKLSYNKIIYGTRFLFGSEFYLDVWNNWSIEVSNHYKRLIENSVHTFSVGFSSVLNNLVPTDKRIEFIRIFLDSIRFFSDNSGYFFVDDMRGNSISLPIRKDLEGTNIYDYKDPKGKYTVREMIDIIKKNGRGFTEYYFTNPLTQTDEKKIVYIEKIEGTDYFIGAGFYISLIK